jgi:hypothetical protein
MKTNLTFIALLACLTNLSPALAADLVLPQNRQAYFTDEPIEMAIVDTSPGQPSTLTLQPANPKTTPITITQSGPFTLPPGTLAPGKYTLTLDGKPLTAPLNEITISSGVPSSTMPVSQTGNPATGGGNFQVSHAFNFGLYDGPDKPALNTRSQRSPGMQAFENAVAQNTPALVYMYWTGFVTHKPFGTEKSWADSDMQSLLSQMNLHLAQRLRRYGKAVMAVGTIDEPGLAWGKTPAGGMASGFPNPDEKPWYKAQGWIWTDTIATQSDNDWANYVNLRTDILRLTNQQAKDDIKSIWPTAVFSTDLYAVHAVMDGCNPASQEINDIPATHVFFDWMGGPLGVPGQLYLEKATRPTDKIAHAMNGQLDGIRGPQRHLYHTLLNAMLQSGLASNWWLNMALMSQEDLALVNGPVARLGPLFQEMSPSDHDVAVLYSFREMAMRQKEMARIESANTTGQQPSLLLPLPDENLAANKTASIKSNAYEVGGVYGMQLLGTHQALRRAGYPAHFVQDSALDRLLPNYNTLVITGQTFPLEPKAQAAIAAFAARGGKIVIDKSTTVPFPNAITHNARLGAQDLRLFQYEAQQKASQGKTPLEISKYQTNLHGPYGDSLFRQAVHPILVAMKQTKARRILAPDNTDLSVERHVAGQGALIMVLNGHEALSPLNENQYAKYNPAPLQTAFALQNIPAGSAVYVIQGLDWSNVSRVENPSLPISASFEPGEMKLYLIAPKPAEKLITTTSATTSSITIQSQLVGPKMPWPITVTVLTPDGAELYKLSRATSASGLYTESLPLGSNAPAGQYTVKVQSFVGPLDSSAQITFTPTAFQPTAITANARTLDAAAITQTLSSKDPITLAFTPAQKDQAQALTARLKQKGVNITAKPLDQNLWQKRRYPIVINPYIASYSPGAQTPLPPELKVEKTLTITIDKDGTPCPADWRTPGSLVTITGDNPLLDWRDQDLEVLYHPGVQFYVQKNRSLLVVSGTKKELQTTPDLREKLRLPWTAMSRYVGQFQYPPELPTAYQCDTHLILLGTAKESPLHAALLASEILTLNVDDQYPGPGRAILQHAWSPFKLGKNVILLSSSDAAGLSAAADALIQLTSQKTAP